MHADRPGDRPRLLYWYRTAPGIALGRSPLDEDAIRAIEDQYPDIDFDWPAILALSEVMTPEDEAPAPRAQRDQREQREPRRERRPKNSDRASDSDRQPRESSASAPENSGELPESPSAGAPPSQLRRDDRTDDDRSPVDAEAALDSDSDLAREAEVQIEASPAPRQSRPSGLVDQLAGREIASRLRGRYEEITLCIRGADDAIRDSLMKRAEALDPDRWETPQDVLQGVSSADALFEQLRSAVAPKS